MLKVLLVAPTDPKDPSDLRLLFGGENTFCKSLLSNSPKGVSFTYFHEALKRGDIGYTFLHHFLNILTKLRILPIGGGNQCFHIKVKFDLIHCHAYGIKIDCDIPILLSDSSSNYLFLRDYLNWPAGGIKMSLAIKRFILKAFNVLDPDVNVEGAKKLIVFSKFAFNIHKFLGNSASKIELLYPGISGPGNVKKKGKELVHILFVGTWFERKGGPLLLEAFKRLSKKYPKARLTIVGEVPKKFKVKSSKLKIYNYVLRESLMREFFPKADIFVLVPPKVEGFGFAAVEAMSFGIPTVVSNVCALPELVENGQSGFVVKGGSIDDLRDKLEILICDQTLREKMGEAARKRFVEKFSIEKLNASLLKIYNEAIKYS